MNLEDRKIETLFYTTIDKLKQIPKLREADTFDFTEFNKLIIHCCDIAQISNELKRAIDINTFRRHFVVSPCLNSLPEALFLCASGRLSKRESAMSNSLSKNSRRVPRISEDLIRGASNISEELGEPLRRTYYLLETGQLPAWKMGSRWYLRRSALVEHFDRLEQEASNG